MITLVNALTGLRFILSVFVYFLILGNQPPVIILGAFVLIGASDWLDGRLARRFQAETRAGAVFDVLADMTFMVLSYIALIAKGLLPLTVLGLLFYKFIEFSLTSYIAGRRSLYRKKVFLFDPVGRLAAILFYMLPSAAVLGASLMELPILFGFLFGYLLILLLLVCISSFQRIKQIIGPMPQF